MNSQPQIRMKKSLLRSTNSSGSSSSVCSLTTLHSEDDRIDRATSYFKEVLTEQHVEIIQNIDLKSTYILDNFIKDEVLHESDVERVRRQNSRQDQNRELMITLHRMNKNSIVRFIGYLHEDYPELSKDLQQKLDLLMCESERQHSCTECVVCRIKNKVNFRDVMDRLFSRRIIGLEILDIASRRPTNILGWQQIEPAIRTPQNVQELIEALREKHTDLADLLEKYKIKKFHCFCTKLHKIKYSKEKEDCNLKELFDSFASSNSLSSRSRSSENVNENASDIDRFNEPNENKGVDRASFAGEKENTQDHLGFAEASLCPRRANSLPASISKMTSSTSSTKHQNVENSNLESYQETPESELETDDLKRTIYDNNFQNTSFQEENTVCIKRRKAIRRKSDNNEQICQ